MYVAPLLASKLFDPEWDREVAEVIIKMASASAFKISDWYVGEAYTAFTLDFCDCSDCVAMNAAKQAEWSQDKWCPH